MNERNIYVDRGYTDGTIPYWRFPHEILVPRHGFKDHYTLFANAYIGKQNEHGGWDFDKLLTVLDSDDFPPNCKVLIDYEGAAGMLYDHLTWTIKPDVLERIELLLEICRAERPDCDYGLFECPPVGAYSFWMGSDQATLDAMDRLNGELKPLADSFDYVVPCFYESKAHYGTLDRILLQIRRVLESCQKHYSKPIIPILWPQWMDIRAPQGSPPAFTDAMTAEANMPGTVLRPMLDTISAYGISQIILYGSGNYPWRETYDWVKEVVKWQNTSGV